MSYLTVSVLYFFWWICCSYLLDLVYTYEDTFFSFRLHHQNDNKHISITAQDENWQDKTEEKFQWSGKFMVYYRNGMGM